MLEWAVKPLELGRQLSGVRLQRGVHLRVAGSDIDSSHRQVAFGRHLGAIGILPAVDTQRIGKLFPGLSVQALVGARHTEREAGVLDSERDALLSL